MIKRSYFDADRTLILPWLRRTRPVVNAQAFTRGRQATISVACWKGEVIASVCGEVLRTWKPQGPASVLRLTDAPAMLSAAQKLARRLELTGLYGFDFILEEETGKPLLIEMNPRATQTCHLALGPKHDIPAAMTAKLTGEPAPVSKSVTDRQVIALFPLEWQNDPNSPFIESGYHDVPQSEPAFVQACRQHPIAGWMTYENLDKVLSILPWHRY